MAIKTQLFKLDIGGGSYAFKDINNIMTSTNANIRFDGTNITQVVIEAGSGRDRTSESGVSIAPDAEGNVSFSNGDSLNVNTAIHTFAEGIANYFDTPDYIDPVEPDVSDANIALPQEILVGIDSEGLKHKISKALNFKGDPNQISVVTQADGTVTITLSEDLALNYVQAQSADFHGDVTIDNGGKLVVDDTVSAKGMILGSYTQAQVDAGEVPKNALIRVVAA